MRRRRWAKNFAIGEDVDPQRGQDHDNREPHAPVFMELTTRLLLVVMTFMVVMVMARMVVVLIHDGSCS